jgi:hypothetical protein
VDDSSAGDGEPRTVAQQDAPAQSEPELEQREDAASGPEEASGANRREFPRFPCEGRAQICLPFGGLLLNGRIIDISVAGCLVQASRIMLEAGTEVEVYFETKLYKFKVDGHIARLIPGKGVGVMFHDPSARVSFQIRELISELQMQEEAG